MKASMEQPLGEWTCTRCGRVHMRISLEVAEQILRSNPGEAMEIFVTCFGCGASTSQFRPAREDDAPVGVTLTCCVIP